MGFFETHGGKQDHRPYFRSFQTFSPLVLFFFFSLRPLTAYLQWSRAGLVLCCSSDGWPGMELTGSNGLKVQVKYLFFSLSLLSNCTYLREPHQPLSLLLDGAQEARSVILCCCHCPSSCANTPALARRKGTMRRLHSDYCYDRIFLWGGVKREMHFEKITSLQATRPPVWSRAVAAAAEPVVRAWKRPTLYWSSRMSLRLLNFKWAFRVLEVRGQCLVGLC